MEVKMWKCFQNLSPSFAADIVLAMVVGTNGEVGIMVMRNDDVYSVGASENGLLGVSGLESSLVPVKIEALCQKRIKSIRAGQDFVLALTKDGLVYSWGNSVHGQLGIGSVSGVKDTPQFCTIGGQKITQIACGKSHALALTSKGEVYAWGRNDKSQVGCGSSTPSVPAPVLVLSSPNAAIEVCSSRHHSLALDGNGQIWGWGKRFISSMNGGHNVSPALLTHLKDIKQITAGANNALAITHDGKLYYWGYQQRTPIQIGENLGAVDEIGGLWSFDTYAFKSGCSVYLWGLFGQWLTAPQATYFPSLDHVFAHLYGIMWKPVTFLFRDSELVTALSKALDDKETSDIKFAVEEKEIRAHKVILRSRSEYFRKMFDNDWKESSEKSAINIGDTSYDAFRSLLYYLYTDRFYPKDIDHTVELLSIADRYGEMGLFVRCADDLKLRISEENACELFEVAVLHDAKELEHTILEFVGANFVDVLVTDGFRNLSRDLLVRMIRKLASQDVFKDLQPFTWDDTKGEYDGDVTVGGNSIQLAST